MGTTDAKLVKKYTIKVIANFVSMSLGIVTQILVPRALGPVLFGQMSYLNSLFQQIFMVFDLGFINYFYTKFSSDSEDNYISTFYLVYFFAISALLFILTLIFLASDLWVIFSLESNQFFLYSFFWGFFFTLSLIFDKCADALGVTIKAERIRIFNKVFFAGLLVLLITSSNFSLTIYFYYMFSLYFSLLIQFYFLFVSVNENIFSNVFKVISKFPNTFLDFFKYSKHLIAILLLGSFSIVFDRWLLQLVGGDEQQGFYAFAFVIASICMLFTSAFIPLIWREITLNVSQDNKKYLSDTIDSSFKFLFVLSSVICSFLFVFSDLVTLVAGGEQYEEAVAVVLIMSLYPIHQTYGQLSSAMFLALSQTELYSKIAVSYILAGLFVSPILLFNFEYFGIESAAVALALKMVIWQYFGVNTQLYFNCSHAGSSFFRLALHQHLIIFIMLFLCLGIRNFYDDFLLIDNHMIVLALSFFSYSTIILILSYFFKSSFGIKNNILDKLTVLKP